MDGLFDEQMDGLFDEQMKNAIRELYQNKISCDVILILKDSDTDNDSLQISAHKWYLSSVCPYFKSLFNFFREKDQSEIIMIVPNKLIVCNIIELSYGIPISKPDLPVWRYQLEFIICSNYLLVHVPTSILERLIIPDEGYDLLLNVAEIIKDENIRKLFDQNFPEEHDKLLAEGIIVCEHPDLDLLLRYIRKNNIKIVTLLISKDTINVYKYSYQILTEVLSFDNSEMINLLIKSGIDMYFVKNYIFCESAQRGYLEIVKLLLQLGINEKIRNNALHSACLYGHVEIVELLVEKDNKIDIENFILLLDKLSQRGHFSIRNRLLKNWKN